MLKKSIKADAVLSAPENRLPIKDMIFAGILYILSILLIHETPFFHYDPNSAILLAVILFLSLLYQTHCYGELQKSDWYLWIFLLIDLLPNIIYTGHSLLKTANYFFLHMMLAYWFLSCAHHRIQDKESDFIVIDILHAVFHAPFHYLNTSLSFFKDAFAFNNCKKDVFKILIGCLLSIPALLIILPLLARADANFQDYLSHIQIDISLLSEWIITCLIAIPLFLYYFSMSFGNMKNQAIPLYEEEKELKRIKKLSIIPEMIYTTLEAILCVTYLIFLFANIQSILSALGASRMMFSYSSFARQGFFELCMIATLNLSLIFFVRLTSKQKNKTSIRMEKLLIIETLMIIVSAMMKMLLYVFTYRSLTYLRIYASWFMIVLLGLFLILLFQTKKTKHQLLPMVRYVILCFLVLNLSNVSYWASDSLQTMEYPIEESNVSYE